MKRETIDKDSTHIVNVHDGSKAGDTTVLLHKEDKMRNVEKGLTAPEPSQKGMHPLLWQLMMLLG